MVPRSTPALGGTDPDGAPEDPWLRPFEPLRTEPDARTRSSSRGPGSRTEQAGRAHPLPAEPVDQARCRDTFAHKGGRLPGGSGPLTFALLDEAAGLRVQAGHERGQLLAGLLAGGAEIGALEDPPELEDGGDYLVVVQPQVVDAGLLR